ncbi:hypothetical protein ZTR_07198 [Talaromyces verruculosus]|nr:hypothetical protein ZTR_07198 [Talaromyces verruculosus]
MDLPTIVLIPGAWHTPEYYGQVIAILQAQGYPTTTVSLPSVGGLSTMLDDAAAIQDRVSRLADEGKKIILVMHSYGGMPGTESAKGLAWRTRQAEGRSGGIVHLVYISAYLVKEGMSVIGMANGAEWPQFLRLENGMIFYDPSAAVQNLYNDFPDDQDPETWASKLRPQSAASFDGSLTYPAYRDIPTTYLLCEKDRSIPVEIQQVFVRNCDGDIRLGSCQAGHSPMITMPSLVAETIVTAAQHT